MSNDNFNTFKSVIDRIGKFDRKTLSERPEWGAANFNEYQDDFDRVFVFIDECNTLPYQLVPDSEFTTVNQSLTNILNSIETIDKFNVSDQQRSAIVTYCNTIKNNIPQLIKFSASWTPYLSYLNGDMSKVIKNVIELKDNAANQIDELSSIRSSFEKETKEILNAMRDASASAGVAQFNNDFQEAANNKNDDIKFWGRWFFWLTLSSILISIIFCIFFIYKYSDAEKIPWAIVSAKFIVIALLISVSMWCGKMYKTEKHQQEVNRFKANSLRTFQAFIKATDNDETRNAVLLETTRAIFSSFSPGYINQDANTNDSLKVLEIFKSIQKPG